MKKIWREFKSFALSGSMLDLALGFIIATAFADVITSLSRNIIMQLIAAIFGEESFAKLHGSVAGTRVPYGLFLTDLLNFVLFAFVLFLMLKMIAALGWGRTRAFEERQCPYCMEFIAPRAIVCRFCRQSLVAELPDLATAEARAAKLRERRRMNLPELPDIELPGGLPKLRRKPAAAGATAGVVAGGGVGVATRHESTHDEPRS